MIKFLYTKKQKKFILLNNKQQKGFSLIEMMVVVVILGLIVLGLVTFFMGGTKSWVVGQSQLEAQRNARQAMDRMVREIRKGKNVISGSNDTVTVKIPPLGGEPDYEVTYYLYDTTIFRRKNSTTPNPLIDDVQRLEFSYFDSSESLVDPPNNTVSKMHIILEVDIDSDSNPDVILNTDVNLRNFGL